MSCDRRRVSLAAVRTSDFRPFTKKEKMSISIELGYLHGALLWGFCIGYIHGAAFGVIAFIHLYVTAIILGFAPYNEIVLLFSRSKTSQHADIKRLTDEIEESEEAYASLAVAYGSLAERYTSLVPLPAQLQGQKEKIQAKLNLEIKQLKFANARLK